MRRAADWANRCAQFLAIMVAILFLGFTTAAAKKSENCAREEWDFQLLEANPADLRFRVKIDPKKPSRTVDGRKIVTFEARPFIQKASGEEHYFYVGRQTNQGKHLIYPGRASNQGNSRFAFRLELQNFQEFYDPGNDLLPEFRVPKDQVKPERNLESVDICLVFKSADGTNKRDYCESTSSLEREWIRDKGGPAWCGLVMGIDTTTLAWSNNAIDLEATGIGRNIKKPKKVVKDLNKVSTINNLNSSPRINRNQQALKISITNQKTFSIIPDSFICHNDQEHPRHKFNEENTVLYLEFDKYRPSRYCRFGYYVDGYQRNYAGFYLPDDKVENEEFDLGQLEINWNTDYIRILGHEGIYWIDTQIHNPSGKYFLRKIGPSVLSNETGQVTQIRPSDGNWGNSLKIPRKSFDVRFSPRTGTFATTSEFRLSTNVLSPPAPPLIITGPLHVDGFGPRFNPGEHRPVALSEQTAAAKRSAASVAEPTGGYSAAKEPYVKSIQRALKAMGFDPGRIDGSWGKKTASAVGQAQRDLGLRTGPEDLERLAAELEQFVPKVAENYKLSRDRQYVFELQSVLKAYGHDIIPDGRYGEQTQSALDNTLRELGLTERFLSQELLATLRQNEPLVAVITTFRRREVDSPARSASLLPVGAAILSYRIDDGELKAVPSTNSISIPRDTALVTVVFQGNETFEPIEKQFDLTATRIDRIRSGHIPLDLYIVPKKRAIQVVVLKPDETVYTPSSEVGVDLRKDHDTFPTDVLFFGDNLTDASEQFDGRWKSFFLTVPVDQANELIVSFAGDTLAGLDTFHEKTFPITVDPDAEFSVPLSSKAEAVAVVRLPYSPKPFLLDARGKHRTVNKPIQASSTGDSFTVGARVADGHSTFVALELSNDGLYAGNLPGLGDVRHNIEVRLTGHPYFKSKTLNAPIVATKNAGSQAYHATAIFEPIVYTKEVFVAPVALISGSEVNRVDTHLNVRVEVLRENQLVSMGSFRSVGSGYRGVVEGFGFEDYKVIADDGFEFRGQVPLDMVNHDPAQVLRVKLGQTRPALYAAVNMSKELDRQFNNISERQTILGKFFDAIWNLNDGDHTWSEVFVDAWVDPNRPPDRFIGPGAPVSNSFELNERELFYKRVIPRASAIAPDKIARAVGREINERMWFAPELNPKALLVYLYSQPLALIDDNHLMALEKQLESLGMRALIILVRRDIGDRPANGVWTDPKQYAKYDHEGARAIDARPIYKHLVFVEYNVVKSSEQYFENIKNDIISTVSEMAKTGRIQ